MAFNRVPEQKQQISKQIEDKNRKVGRVLTKNTKYYSFGGENVVEGGEGSGQLFRWRKRWFIQQAPTTYFCPSNSTFLDWIVNGGDVVTEYIENNYGNIADRNILQFANICYDIEVFRSTHAQIIVPIGCTDSLRIVVDDEELYNSGTNGPNQLTSITINLNAGWTKITLFFYTSFPLPNRRFDFTPNFHRYVEDSRIPIPETPSELTASQGLEGFIHLNWFVSEPHNYQYFQFFRRRHDISNFRPHGPFVYYSENGHDDYISNPEDLGASFFYKVRGITDNNQVTDFSNIAEGWTADPTNPDEDEPNDIDNGFTILLPINSGVGDTNTIGYYSGENIVFDVKALYSLPSGEFPTVYICQTSGTETITGYTTLSETVSNKFWRYSYNVSGLDSGNFGEGLATVYAQYTATDPIYGNENYIAFNELDSTYNSLLTGYSYILSTGDVITGPIDTSGFSFTNSSYTMTGNSFYLEASYNINNINILPNTSEAAIMQLVIFHLSGTDLHISGVKTFSTLIESSMSVPLRITGSYLFTNLEPETQYGFSMRFVATDNDPSNTITGSGEYVQMYYDEDIYRTLRGHTTFVVDNTSPTYEFILDGDGTLNDGSEDPYTRTSLVYAIPLAQTDDPDDNAVPDSNGTKYVAEIYQVRHATGEDALTSATWFNYIQGVPFIVNLVETGEKTVYGQARDRAGNISATYSDTIHYLSGGDIPSQPHWHSYFAIPQGISLTWTGGTELDLLGYRLYRKEGTQVGDPTPGDPLLSSFDILYSPIDGATYVHYIDPRESLPVTSSLYTYWLKAFDSEALESIYSDPVTTGIQTISFEAPTWDSGNCYGDFGFVHLTLNGIATTYNALGGYVFYRATGNDSSLAEVIGTVYYETAGGTIPFNDVHAETWKSYWYWAKAISTYGDEGPLSDSIGPLNAEPNYENMFVNYLDNSSFERPLTDWDWSNIVNLESGDAYHGNKYAIVKGMSWESVAYEGYIFVEGNSAYTVSFYANDITPGTSGDLIVTGTWYSIDKTQEIGYFGVTIYQDQLATGWNRYVCSGAIISPFIYFQSPVEATSATIQIGTSKLAKHIAIDAIQFEQWTSNSPAPYRDSHVINADRFNTHFLRAEMISADSIFGNRIRAQQISGQHIIASSITAEHMQIGRMHNFVPNSSFEMNGLDMYDVPIYEDAYGYDVVHDAIPYWGFYEYNEDGTYHVTSETGANFGITNAPAPDAGGGSAKFGEYVLRIYPYNDDPDPATSVYYAESTKPYKLESGYTYTFNFDIIKHGNATNPNPAERFFLGFRFLDENLNELAYDESDPGATYVNITGLTGYWESGYGPGTVFYNPEHILTPESFTSNDTWYRRSTRFYVNDGRAKFAKILVGLEYKTTGNDLTSNTVVWTLDTYENNLWLGGNADYQIGDFLMSGFAIYDSGTRLWTKPNAGLLTDDTPNIENVVAMEEFDGDLYIGGLFYNISRGASHTCNITKWNGSTWTEIQNGIADYPNGFYYQDPWNNNYRAPIQDLVSYSGELWILGSFDKLHDNTVCSGIVRYDGVSTWTPLTTPPRYPDMMRGIVKGIVYSGELYVGGGFTQIDGQSITMLARYNYNTDTWSDVKDVATDGVILNVGNGCIWDMCIWSGYLVVAGYFTTISGGGNPKLNVNQGIALWDINTQTWSALGHESLGVGLAYPPYKLHLHTDDKLYACGNFETAIIDGISTNGFNHVARWNFGSDIWEVLGSGLAPIGGSSCKPTAMTSFDGRLIVGGQTITGACAWAGHDAVSAINLVCWDDTVGWSVLSSGVEVYSEGNNSESVRPWYSIDGVQFAIGDQYWPYMEDEIVRIEHGAISADAVNANNIRALNISGGHIQSETLETRHFQADTIETEFIKVRSSNLLTNANFDRFNSFELGRPDFWPIYSGGSNSVKPYQYTNTRKFGSSSLLLSGNRFQTFALYSQGKPGGASPETGYLYVAKNYTTPYYKDLSFGCWIYKFSTSPTVTLYAKIIEYNDVDTEVGSHSFIDALSINSNYDSKWTFISGTINQGTIGNYNKLRLTISFSDQITSNIGILLDGIRLVEGSEAPSGFLNEGVTIIDGSYIKTGTIDADIVTIQGNDGSVTINEDGIRIGNTVGYGTSISGFTSINGTDIQYYDYQNPTTQYVSWYPRRIQKFVGISNSLSTIISYPIFPLRRFPKVIVSPIDQRTLVYTGWTSARSINIPHQITNANTKIYHGISNIDTEKQTSISYNPATPTNYFSTNEAYLTQGTTYSIASITSAASGWVIFKNLTQSGNIADARYSVTLTGLSNPSVQSGVIRYNWAWGYANGDNFLVHGYLTGAEDVIDTDSFAQLSGFKYFINQKIVLTTGGEFNTPSPISGWALASRASSSTYTGTYTLDTPGGVGLYLIDTGYLYNTGKTTYDIVVLE